jgi:outer membrane immunogenic protein
LHLNSHTYSGWFIGTGYEYGLTFLPGLFWKTEYRYSDYKSADLSELLNTTNLTSGILIHSTKFEQAVRSELVWRFNWAGPLRAAY